MIRLAVGLIIVLLATGAGPAGKGVGKPAQNDRRRMAVADLLAYVERFTGKGPSDCGQLNLERPFSEPSESALQQAIDCGVGAARDGKPFWLFRQGQGIDSLIFDGLLGSSDHVIYRFNYDSAPCGGPGCYGRFEISRCDAPNIMRNARGVPMGFGCALR